MKKFTDDVMVLPKKILTHEGMELPLALASDPLWFLKKEFHYEKTEKQKKNETDKVAKTRN